MVISLVWLGASRVEAHLPYIVPTSLYIGAGALAAALGAYPARGLLAIGRDIGLLAWSAAIANVIRTPEAFATIARAWVYGAATWAVALILAMVARHWGLVDGPGSLPASLSLEDPSLMGDALALAFFVFLVGPSPRSFLARLAVAATLLAGVLTTGSHAAMWAVLAGGVATGFVSIWRSHDLVAAIGSLVIGIALLAALAAVALGIFIQLGAPGDIPSIGRPTSIVQAQRPAFLRPFGPYLDGSPIGSGPASTRSRPSPPVGADTPGTSTYLVTLVERGPVGVVGLVVLFGGLLIRAQTLALRDITSAFERMVHSAAGLVGGIVAIGVAGVGHDVLHDPVVWAFFGLLAGLYLFALSSEPADRAAPQMIGA